MLQSRLGRDVAFKLHPIEPLNIVLGICFDESVKFAIGDAIEDPPVRADILR